MDNLTLLLDNLIFFFLYILFLIIHTLYNYTYPFDYPYQIMDNNVPENFFGSRWISKQFSKLGSAPARHTGQEEGEKVGHLIKRVAILLQRGLSSMLLNQIPGHPLAEIDGQE